MRKMFQASAFCKLILLLALVVLVRKWDGRELTGHLPRYNVLVRATLVDSPKEAKPLGDVLQMELREGNVLVDKKSKRVFKVTALTFE